MFGDEYALDAHKSGTNPDAFKHIIGSSATDTRKLGAHISANPSAKEKQLVSAMESNTDVMEKFGAYSERLQ